MEFERGVKRCLDSSPRGLDSSPQCLETALSPRANLEAEVEPTVPPKGPRTSRGDLSHRFATKAEFTSLREQLHNLEARLDSMNWNLVGGQGQARDAPEPAKPVSNVTESEEAPSEAEAKEATVSFSESIWDTAILIGMPPIGEAGSFLLGLGLVLNILIQAIFILIIYENLAQKVFSEEDLAGLSAFRHKIAHDARFVSEASGVSLADRVCNEDLTLEMATTQVTRLAEIKAYLGEEGSLTQFLNGPLMCQLALAVWIMCILKEVSASWNIFSALRRLPSHAGRGSQVTKKGDEGCKLLHLSRARKLFALLICMLRLTVAIVLLWIGTQYLCYTTSIGDLLLNAIALEVVINIDDMVFSAMAPVSAVEVVAELAPLPLPSWPRWRGADMGALATPVILVGLMVLCGFTSLADTIHNLQDAQERLCGQNTHFMYQFDGLRMARVQPLAPFNIDEAYNIDGIASLAVKEVKSDLPHSQWQYALLSDSTSSQRFMDQASESAMMATVRDIYRSRQRIDELVSQCHDAFDRIAAAVLPAMLGWSKQKDPEQQEAALAELQEKMKGEAVPGRYPGTTADESDFRRFLIARDYDVPKAEAMLRKHIDWRKQTFPIQRDATVDMLLDSKRVGDIIGWNALNEPVVLFDCAWGSLLAGGVSVEKFSAAYILFVESILTAMQGRSSQRWCWLSIGGPPPMDLAKHLSGLFEANYPELLHVAVIAPIPQRIKQFINSMIWFLPEKTKAKFAVATSSTEVCEFLSHQVQDLPEHLRDIESYERDRRKDGISVEVQTEEGHRQIIRYVELGAGATASVTFELEDSVESVGINLSVSQPTLLPRLLVGEHDLKLSVLTQGAEEKPIVSEQMVTVSAPCEQDWKREKGISSLSFSMDNTHSRMSGKSVTLGILLREKKA